MADILTTRAVLYRGRFRTLWSGWRRTCNVLRAHLIRTPLTSHAHPDDAGDLRAALVAAEWGMQSITVRLGRAGDWHEVLLRLHPGEHYSYEVFVEAERLGGRIPPSDWWEPEDRLPVSPPVIAQRV